MDEIKLREFSTEPEDESLQFIQMIDVLDTQSTLHRMVFALAQYLEDKNVDQEIIEVRYRTMDFGERRAGDLQLFISTTKEGPLPKR